MSILFLVLAAIFFGFQAVGVAAKLDWSAAAWCCVVISVLLGGHGLF